MIIIISGASHTGKTKLAQYLLESLHIPYISIDHLKMGLIRSGKTHLTVEDSDALTTYLWPIVREMIKTAIENKQHLIIEGCYVPFEFAHDFEPFYLQEITYTCLVFSDKYIHKNYDKILEHESDIESRLESGISKEWLLNENRFYEDGCKLYDLNYVLIEKNYERTMKRFVRNLINYVKISYR